MYKYLYLDKQLSVKDPKASDLLFSFHDSRSKLSKRGEAATYDFYTCQKFWLNFKININSADKKSKIACEVKLLD